MTDLEFYGHEGVYADFLIATRPVPERIADEFVRLGARMVDAEGWCAFLWGQSIGNRFLSGLGILDGEFLIGPRRIKEMPTSFGCGGYAFVDVSSDVASVVPDPFGMHPVYAGSGIVTNRLHLAAMLVRDLNFGAALASTYNEGVFSFSFNTRSTPVLGVDLLGVGERVSIRNEIVVDSSDVVLGFDQADPGTYEYYIERGAREIISNVEAVLDSGLPVVCDITGGRDSRIVFGALVALGRVSEVSFNTIANNPELNSDLLIGSGLVAKYGGSYEVDETLAGYAQFRDEDPFLKRRSQVFGSYHFVTEGEVRTVNPIIQGYSIRMLGGGGELYRDYYQSLFSSVDQTSLSCDALIENMLYSHHGTVFGSDFLPEYLSDFKRTFDCLPGETIGHKLDAHYLNFRNRFHFGARGSSGGSMLVVNPALSKWVLRAARSLPLTEKASGRVLFDLIRAMDEELAFLPFDKPIDATLFQSPYHRTSSFEDKDVTVDPAPHLLEVYKKSSRARPLRPASNVISFESRLSREIDESIAAIGSSNGPFGALIGPRLSSFIDYAKDKSPRHFSATASRLRAFADYAHLML